MTAELKRRGRPPKSDAERKRGNFTFRVRDKLKAEIERAAIASGRSASEEIEHRLEKSFLEDEIIRRIRDAAARIPERWTRERSFKHDFHDDDMARGINMLFANGG